MLCREINNHHTAIIIDSPVGLQAVHGACQTVPNQQFSSVTPLHRMQKLKTSDQTKKMKKFNFGDQLENKICTIFTARQHSLLCRALY